MVEKFKEAYVRRRLKRISRYTGGGNKVKAIIERMANDFGVDSQKYDAEMSEKEIIKITLKNQHTPSQLEEDLNNEIRSFL